MNIIQSDNSGGISIDAAAYMLIPFKNLYDRDKSKDKALAIKELTYIYFMNDMRSDYLIIIDIDLRAKEVISDIGLPKNWTEDEIVKKASLFYKEHSKSPISELYHSTQIAVDVIRQELENARKLLDMQTDKGLQVYKIADILNAIAKVPDVMRKLKEAEREYIKEINSGKEKSGSRVHNEFEDGF